VVLLLENKKHRQYLNPSPVLAGMESKSNILKELSVEEDSSKRASIFWIKASRTSTRSLLALFLDDLLALIGQAPLLLAYLLEPAEGVILALSSVKTVKEKMTKNTFLLINIIATHKINYC